MTWRDYHEATKHSVESLRRSQHFLDWKNMPDPFRHYGGVPLLDLPADPPGPAIPALEVLQGAYGVGSSDDGPAFLSILLFYSAAISASKRVLSTGYRYSLRVNPSSGNLHPTEFHFLTRGLEQWPDGLYHYRPSSAYGGAASDRRFPHPSRRLRTHHFYTDQHRVAGGLEIPRSGLSILHARYGARLAGSRACGTGHGMR